jgi:hypothetical protein
MLPPAAPEPLVPTEETFSYDIGLTTWRDYARWRLDDVDEGAPYIWDATYDRLLQMYGPVEGIAMAASAIALIISKQVTAFGEAAGIRFSKRNLDYYQKIPDIIRGEPVWGQVKSRLIRVGKLPSIQTRSQRDYQIWNMNLLWPSTNEIRLPDTLPIWEN